MDQEPKNSTSGERNMEFRYNENVSVKDIADLRESVGWNRMEKELGNPLFSSFYHIAVYESDELIGFIDCVSNGVTDAYIQDLMVHSDHQGKGIGTELMNRMIACLKEKHIYMISVIFEEALMSFYQKFGFYFMMSGQMETYFSE